MADLQNGGSVRGYQAIFVPLAALSSPGYSPVGGQPAVYLYIAALEANCPLLPRSAHWGDGEHLAAGNHEVVRMARMLDLGKSCLEGALEHGSWVVGAQLKQRPDLAARHRAPGR